jgi:hypothetical protein
LVALLSGFRCKNVRWVLGVKNVRWVLGVKNVRWVLGVKNVEKGFTVLMKCVLKNPLGFVWQLNSFLLTKISR